MHFTGAGQSKILGIVFELGPPDNGIVQEDHAPVFDDGFDGD